MSEQVMNTFTGVLWMATFVALALFGLFLGTYIAVRIISLGFVPRWARRWRGYRDPVGKGMFCCLCEGRRCGGGCAHRSCGETIYTRGGKMHFSPQRGWIRVGG